MPENHDDYSNPESYCSSSKTISKKTSIGHVPWWHSAHSVHIAVVVEYLIATDATKGEHGKMSDDSENRVEDL